MSGFDAPRAVHTLVVDDHGHDAHLLETLLNRVRDLKFTVEVVGRLSSALARLDEEAFDIILLDLSLPDSHGLATLQQVRDHSPELPVVVLTGVDDNDLALQAVKAGAQDYLVKSMDAGDSMVRAVHYAVERSWAARKHHETEQQLYQLADEMPCLLWATDKHGALSEVHGGMPELRNRVASWLAHDVGLKQATADALSGESASLELSDGGRIYHVRVDPLRSSETVAGTIGAALDITDQKLVERELQLTRQIQRALLPTTAPQVPGFDIAGASRPAGEAGGDYFDYLVRPDGGLSIAICDVGGHGLGPAILMAQTRAYLRSLATTSEQPSVTLRKLNDFLCEETSEERLVAMMLLSLNATEKSFIYVSAGQPTYVIDSTGASRLLEANTIPLNVQPIESMADSDPVQLQSGDLVLLFTDGIVEAESVDKQQFGNERMLSLVHQQRDYSAEAIVDALFRAVDDHTGGRQYDDMTAVLVKVD